jgi:hypothetical protein
MSRRVWYSGVAWVLLLALAASGVRGDPVPPEPVGAERTQ